MVIREILLEIELELSSFSYGERIVAPAAVMGDGVKSNGGTYILVSVS